MEIQRIGPNASPKIHALWRFICIASVLAVSLSSTSNARASDASSDWQHIVALDAGPSVKARSQEEARVIASEHLELQEKALRGFVAQYRDDPHFFEAELRLARLLRIRGDFQNSEKARAEARQLLQELAKIASSPEQRAEVDFTRITTLMTSLRTPTQAQREELLNAVQKFQIEHSGDRRLAALLAETATLFDAQTRIKETLLRDANRLATDPELKGRIADDLKRLDLVGKVIPLHSTDAAGKTIDLTNYRGKVVAIIFFAEWSPPSMATVEALRKVIAALPKDRVQALGVSLDEKPEALAVAVRQYGLNWPICFDGKSWESPLVRSLGINTLPTLWLADAKGCLRSLNALDGTASQIQQLLDER